MRIWQINTWQTKNTQWGKNSVFNKWFQDNHIQIKKNETGPLSYTAY